MSDREPVAGPRKKPSQARSAQTVATILEAASQVLEAQGEDGLSTTAVAERAGFSIGTLYQYFPNRDAILLALAERDRAAIVALLRECRKLEPPESDEALRRVVRTLIAIFARRIGARRQFVLMTQAGQTGGGVYPPQDVADTLAEIWTARGSTRSPEVDRARAFVLSRAVGGVLRAAALESADLLGTPELEDALFTLIRALLNAD